MRPPSLFSLFAPISALPGVGPKIAALYQRISVTRVVDLLWHLPSSIVDRRHTPKIIDAISGQIATLSVLIDAHLPPESPKRPYRVRCSDETGFLHLIYFRARDEWLRRSFPVGEWRIVSGLVEHFNSEIQISHPDHIGKMDDIEAVARAEPIYPMTAGLSRKQLSKAISTALDRLPHLPEWQDQSWLALQHWPSWRDALISLHNPNDFFDVDLSCPARLRVAYDELLANQLALTLARSQMRVLKGRGTCGTGQLREKVIGALPYTLTSAQRQALAEIDADMSRPVRMLRLLQGDVGSGKTVVALIAMLNAVECRRQAALLAPTEVLARQHFETFRPFAELLQVRIQLLTGRDKGAGREKILGDLERGNIDILIGTHAIFQEGVRYHDLAIAVIDEQHRFGVHQRLALSTKGRAADLLVMTATPIPRTLLLTNYGDMDISRIMEKPPGRQPVDTLILPLTRIGEVISAVGRAISNGARAYWVCPLVEESETVDLAAADQRYRCLKEVLGECIGLVHGRMKGQDRDQVIDDFSKGKIVVLVATTVIEVGINIPEATIMVIEHAERFGLAQLHQLRGRVGRSDKQSRCLLLYEPPLSQTAKCRLEILRSTEDGFLIAEEDLRLRGGGQALGTRQSGAPEFRVADLSAHGRLLEKARNDAQAILDEDPQLVGPRGQALRVLLYLFERDAAVKTLLSG